MSGLFNRMFMSTKVDLKELSITTTDLKYDGTDKLYGICDNFDKETGKRVVHKLLKVASTNMKDFEEFTKEVVKTGWLSNVWFFPVKIINPRYMKKGGAIFVEWENETLKCRQVIFTAKAAKKMGLIT